jgi:transcriptional regulator with XRE-family HTH domain
MKSKEVGERIRLILKEKGLSQRQVESDSGINQSVLSDVIRGNRDYEKVVERLSTHYGWSRDFIVMGKGNIEQSTIAESNQNDNGLSKEEKLRLINNLEELYRRHQQLLDDASLVMKEIAAINKLLIIGTNQI